MKKFSFVTFELSLEENGIYTCLSIIQSKHAFHYKNFKLKVDVCLLCQVN
jgi:hypothetical protein